MSSSSQHQERPPTSDEIVGITGKRNRHRDGRWIYECTFNDNVPQRSPWAYFSTLPAAVQGQAEQKWPTARKNDIADFAKAVRNEAKLVRDEHRDENDILLEELAASSSSGSGKERKTPKRRKTSGIRVK